MVAWRFWGSFNPPAEKLIASNTAITAKCTSRLKNELDTGFTTAMGLTDSSPNSSVMPRLRQFTAGAPAHPTTWRCWEL
jgi:hypothetical protein